MLLIIKGSLRGLYFPFHYFLDFFLFRFCLSTFKTICLSMYCAYPFNVFKNICTYLSFYLSIYLSIYVYPYLSTPLFLLSFIISLLSSFLTPLSLSLCDYRSAFFLSFTAISSSLYLFLFFLFLFSSLFIFSLLSLMHL